MTRWRSEDLSRAATIDLVRTSLAEVREGRLLKVMGRVQLLEPMVSPLSRRACAAYSVIVQETGMGFDTLVQVVESAARDFVLRDETGFVVVRAANASLFWERDGELRLSPHRFGEGVIEEGAEVTLIGRARRDVDPFGGGYRDPSAPLVFEAATDPLVLVDGATRWRMR